MVYYSYNEREVIIMIENGIDTSKCTVLSTIPPESLTQAEQDIYVDLVNKLIELGQTFTTDMDIVIQYCRCMARLNYIDELLKDGDLTDSKLRQAQKQYWTQFEKLNDKLYLNPSARIKSNNQKDKVKQKAIDPLLEALRG